jgi:hypothetical protein
MASILSKALSLLTGDDSRDVGWLEMPAKRPLKSLTERDLIKLESEIGSQLFGPVPKGRRREFFCLDARTWIWHEEWFDENRRYHVVTTRYEIQDNGILKVSDGARYTYIEGEELKNLTTAIHMYYERVARQIYHVDPDTGERLAHS